MLSKKPFYKFAISLTLLLSVSACSSTIDKPERLKTEGYIFDSNSLRNVPVGSSKQQVLQNFGTPSTDTDLSDNVFYYISQQRYQAALFLKPEIINRRVLAVYFDKNDKVTKVAQYGIKDQKIFDFISQTTPTLTTNKNIILQILGDSKFVPDVLPQQ